MKPFAEVSLIPATDSDTLYLQSELQKYLTTLTEFSSSTAFLGIGGPWLGDTARGRKIRIVSDAFGTKEVETRHELEALVTSMMPAA